MSSMSVGDIVGQINKKHGTGSIMTLQDRTAVKVETISTGSVLLDRALGVGGLPCGRIVEIYGPESSGKTTVCLTTVANAQRAGRKAAFVDVENALDPIYAKTLGVQLDGDNALMISQPNSGEEALNIVEDLIDTGEMGIVVVDSVSALVPQAELNGEMGDSHVGLQARLMSQAMRKLTSKVKKQGTLLFFTNQLRMKIGIQWGNPETTSGGNALKFYASVRMDIRRISKADAEAESTTVKIKVVKNKLAPPFRIAETKIYFGRGFDRCAEILQIGLDEGVIEKRGSWFSCGDTRLGQGFEASVEFLRENPDFAEDIYKCALEEEEEDTTVEDEIKRLQRQLEEEDDVTSIKELRKQIKKLKGKK